MLPCSCFHSNPHSAAVQSLYLQFPAPASLHFLILKPLPSFFFVICFLSHPLHLTVALPSLFLYGYIHIYPLRSQSSSPSSTPFFCLLYLSELREKIVQCRRLEAKSTPSAAAPIRCLFIFLRENRGSCASHSLVSDGSSSSSSSVALYADCSQVDRRKDGQTERESQYFVLGLQLDVLPRCCIMHEHSYS